MSKQLFAGSSTQVTPRRYRLVRPLPGAVVVEVIGEHDLATSGKLEDVLASLVGANILVVADLSETEFLDSSALLALVKADRLARDRGVEFRLQLGTAPNVGRTLEISNILERIPCFATREEALARGPSLAA